MIIIFYCILSFEKMISEDYQGLIICRVIKDLHKENKLFGKQKVTNFDKFEAFCRRSLGIIEVWYVVIILL